MHTDILTSTDMLTYSTYNVPFAEEGYYADDSPGSLFWSTSAGNKKHYAGSAARKSLINLLTSTAVKKMQ